MTESSISIVIPAKNGERYISQTLSKIREQEINQSLEVIVIDSGSTDSTPAIVRTFNEVKLVQIVPEEFGHGRTRNFGLALTSGHIVVFLNHDATPFDEYWLNQLVKNLHRENIVGAYSRQMPRPECSPIRRNELLNTYFYSGKTSRIKKIDDFEKYRAMNAWDKHYLTAFETVSCAVKRSALSEHPFPDVAFGEDTIWAKEMMERGFSICFEPQSVVLHSHDIYRSYKHTLKSQFDCGRFMLDVYGDSMKAYSLSTALQTYRGLVRQDHYFLKLDRSIPLLTRQFWKLYSTYIRTSYVLGFYLGYNYKRLPRSVSGLSLVEELMRARDSRDHKT